MAFIAGSSSSTTYPVLSLMRSNVPLVPIFMARSPSSPTFNTISSSRGALMSGSMAAPVELSAGPSYLDVNTVTKCTTLKPKLSGMSSTSSGIGRPSRNPQSSVTWPIVYHVSACTSPVSLSIVIS